VTFDLVLLGLVLLFALWGAFQGISKQLANLVAVPVAWLAAGPLGELGGPALAKQLSTSLVVGRVAAGFLVFVVVFIVVRLVVAALIRRLLSDGKSDDRGTDRALGALLGGLKVALVAYVVICALSFIESNVQVMGKRLSLSPKDSLSFTFARSYNLFELTHFSQVDTLVRAAKLAQDPAASKLKDSPDLQALLKDQRFKGLIDEPALKKALDTGDTRALLENDAVMRLLSDPTAMRRVERILAARKQ